MISLSENLGQLLLLKRCNFSSNLLSLHWQTASMIAGKVISFINFIFRFLRLFVFLFFLNFCFVSFLPLIHISRGALGMSGNSCKKPEIDRNKGKIILYKKYLITGCAGFIDSNFVHYMLKKYPEILLVNLDKLTYAGNLENLKDVEGDPRHVFVQGDICDKELVESLFAKYDFDYVINFAAESHVDRSIKNPEIFVQSNVMGTVNLLQRAKEAWYDADAKTWKEGKKYLQVSTDEVYGALGAEGFFMETTPLCPHSPYSSSKASADMFVMAFHDTYGMPINITRCSNNYGPYQFPEKLIPLMINNVKHHKQLPVYGDGMQIRDWLYVEDHCKAIDMVCNGGKIGEVYNVGGHNERPNIFIVKTIIEQLHDRLKDDGISEDLIKHVADRLGHDRRYGIDPTKIKNDLGWYPETPFEKGIVLTIDWYLEHEEWMEHITSGNYQKYYQDMYKNKQFFVKFRKRKKSFPAYFLCGEKDYNFLRSTV